MDPVRLALESGWEVGGAKRCVSDVELGDDLSAVSGEHPNRVGAADSGHFELIAGPVLEHRMRSGDAQPVAALLGLGAVGVEDADRHPDRGEGKQPVGAEAAVAVAKNG